MADLDKGGNTLQLTRVYLGPTLGWAMAYINPARFITSAGSTQLILGDSVVFVNVAALVTILLPDAVQWLQQFPMKSAIATFGEYLYIKDYGGNAAAFNITVTPFGTQKIDNLAGLTIGQNRQSIRLYPLADASGWASI